MVCKLAAEPRHFDRLSGAKTAYVDAGRSADEYVDFARAIVDEDNETERQIVHNETMELRPAL